MDLSIEEGVKKVLKEVLKVEDDFDEEASFDKIANIKVFDSLRVLELISKFEKTLKIRISDDDFEKIYSYKTAVEFFKQLKQG